MNYHEQLLVGLVSGPVDQQHTVEQSLTDVETPVNSAAPMTAAEELDEIFSAWESWPDDAFIIY